MNTRLLAAVLLTIGLESIAPAHAADKTPAPAKAVVQISVTDVDAFEGKTLPPLELPASGERMRDDLSFYEAAVCKADLPLVVTPRFTVTTFDGEAGIVREDTRLPYMPVGGPQHEGENPLAYAVMTNSLSAIPHLNSDGTISVDFTLTESKQSDPAWHELGPPNILSATVTTKMTFRDGETRVVNLVPVIGWDNHFSFLTVKLVPAVKG